MAYQEKQTIVSLISTILISTLYCIYVFYLYNNGTYYQTEGPGFWGAIILILVPVLAAPKIIIHIIFRIINKIITDEEGPSFVDELDKLIDLKAAVNFYHFFIAGFFLSMGSLVINMPLSVMFIIQLITIIAAGVFMDISQLYFYRRGI